MKIYAFFFKDKTFASLKSAHVLAESLEEAKELLRGGEVPDGTSPRGGCGIEKDYVDKTPYEVKVIEIDNPCVITSNYEEF